MFTERYNMAEPREANEDTVDHDRHASNRAAHEGMKAAAKFVLAWGENPTDEKTMKAHVELVFAVHKYARVMAAKHVDRSPLTDRDVEVAEEMIDEYERITGYSKEESEE